MVPQFARGHRLHQDKARKRWVILAPERVFEPDEIAVEVLLLVDGVRTIDQIVDTLAEKFAAPREAIKVDVAAMLADLHDRQVLAG